MRGKVKERLGPACFVTDTTAKANDISELGFRSRLTLEKSLVLEGVLLVDEAVGAQGLLSFWGNCHA